MSDSEADTCRKLVVPQLQQAGWDTEPHAIAEQHSSRVALLPAILDHAFKGVLT